MRDLEGTLQAGQGEVLPDCQLPEAEAQRHAGPQAVVGMEVPTAGSHVRPVGFNDKADHHEYLWQHLLHRRNALQDQGHLRERQVCVCFQHARSLRGGALLL